MTGWTTEIDDASARSCPGSRGAVGAIDAPDARSMTMRVDRGRP
ncbi:hypothetical protein [uncultured Amnibacterium sp.]